MATGSHLPTYLSLDEAAEVMSLSVKTIRRRIADGTIPAYQCGRRPIRIRLDELEAALRPIPSASCVTGHAYKRRNSSSQPG
jgi:excisionase family DNA binding protein